MINNRQAGRRRGRGGNNNNGPRPSGGGQRDPGNRIDNRARGNANQLYEKYKNLAADSQRQGDRVTTEYYLQFADHYFRVLSESRSRYDEQNQRRNDAFDAKPFTGSFDTGFDGQDDEYGDEGEPIRAGEQAFVEREDGGEDTNARSARDRGNAQQPRRDERLRDERPREDRPREDRPRDERPREDRPREDRPRDDRPREGLRPDQRGERGTRDTAQDGRQDTGRESGRGDKTEERTRDVSPRDGDAPRPRRQREGEPRMAQDIGPAQLAEPVSAPVSTDMPTDTPAEAEAPRRRGRPRRERPVDEAPVAFDPAVLPPALGLAPTSVEAAASDISSRDDAAPEEEPKPRRRRVRAAPVEEASASD